VEESVEITSLVVAYGVSSGYGVHMSRQVLSVPRTRYESRNDSDMSFVRASCFQLCSGGLDLQFNCTQVQQRECIVICDCNKVSTEICTPCLGHVTSSSADLACLAIDQSYRPLQGYEEHDASHSCRNVQTFRMNFLIVPSNIMFLEIIHYPVFI
jgi:hypothetical protein